MATNSERRDESQTNISNEINNPSHGFIGNDTDNSLDTRNVAENWTGKEEKVFGDARSTGTRSTGGNAAEDLYQMAQQEVDDLSEKAHSLGERARDLTHNIADKAKNAATNLGERASDAGEYVSTTVKTNPLQSLLVGFGVGCLVGILVTGAARK